MATAIHEAQSGAAVLHRLPGRARLRVAPWPAGARRHLEAHLRAARGVLRVEASDRTGNVLVHFRPGETSPERLLEYALQFDNSSEPNDETGPDRTPSEAPHVLTERAAGRVRARISIRGLDRDPRIAPAVLDRLHTFKGVRARANPLTGRVLVEFARGAANLEELIAAVADVDLPPLPDEARPAHPMDPAPLVLGTVRFGAAVTALLFIVVRQLAGQEGPLPGAVALASVFSVLQGVPGLRAAVTHLFGRRVAEVAVPLPSTLSLALAGAPLGLTLAATESRRSITAQHAMREAWRKYESRVRASPYIAPGETVRIEGGERVPLPGIVIEGHGTAIDPDGVPRSIGPGSTFAAGARLQDGPFVLRLEGGQSFAPSGRAEPTAPSVYDRYIQAVAPLGVAYVAITAALTRSTSRTMSALLLVNARPAIVGARGADASALARVIRAGVVVVGTRPERKLRRPDVVILGNARLLVNGLEVASTLPLHADVDLARIADRAMRLGSAAGAPWVTSSGARDRAVVSDASYENGAASGTVDGERMTVRPSAASDPLPPHLRAPHRGEYHLTVVDAAEVPAAVLILRPRLSAAAERLTRLCRDARIELLVLRHGDALAADRIARRAGISIRRSDDDVSVIHHRQSGGRIVYFASDAADCGAAFAAADLAIGISDLRSAFPGRADLLTPDLDGLTAILDASIRRDEAVGDGVAVAALTNIIGASLGARGVPLQFAGRLVESSALAALGVSWCRLRGGEQPNTIMTTLPDPHPERWARGSPEECLRLLGSSMTGLTADQVEERRDDVVLPPNEGKAFLSAVARQFDSPISAIWLGGALLSLLIGAAPDVLFILGTLVLNVAVGAWQERKQERVADALRKLEPRTTVRVVREDRVVEVPGDAVVRGDLLLLASGDRVPADARLISASGLEADEASLTGESLPVEKSPDAAAEHARILLAGSDVTAGHGRAVAVAVGRATRLGATAAALRVQGERKDVLSARLAQLLKEALPVSFAGGASVALAGIVRRQPLGPQLALGSNVALAALPEGLPLLAGAGQAAAARRLAGQGAVVRRLSAVEALGRVDVACVDKTGTLTEGKLRVTLVADFTRESALDASLAAPLREIVLVAAVASPHPDAWAAATHATDLAVIHCAEAIGLRDAIRAQRRTEAPFDATRPFHAAIVEDRLCVKGAPEAVLDRSVAMQNEGSVTPLDDELRKALLARAYRFAERGLRVLFVATGSADRDVVDPRDLTVIGLLGIRDPLRANVSAAVSRCHTAGVRVLMVTGDHPATARAIARDAGLLDGGIMITGPELAQLDNDGLDDRLEHATVIARATPLDKLRIVESLQRRGHTVAMTGDGVNDAPALRLADVGVAMGHAGTDVARQTADVVLTNDDFPALVEGLVEGRGFWGNMRRALSLLLGGNLGELGLLIGATMLGRGSALSIPQILAVNLVTDLLPAMAIAAQEPEHRTLERLAREGRAALGGDLRRSILSRGAATAIPSLGAFALASALGGPREGQTVAFASIVATQLAQTVGLGRSEGRLTPTVFGAVGVSTAALASALMLRPLRAALGLTPLSPFGWLLVGGGTVVAPLLNRALDAGSRRAMQAPSPSIAVASQLAVS